ncbi:MAG: flagellar basal body-associated FliL family protein [Henriciella sp.]
MSEAKDAKTADAAPAKGGLNLVGLLVLGLACAATSFASVFFLAPSPTVVTAEAATTEYVEKAPAQKKDLTYTEVPEILITIGSAPATRYLKMQLSVATDKSDSKKIKSSEPQLIDAFLLYLRSVEVTDFEDPAFYKHMREQLGRRADLVLGDGIVEGVLITEFLLR